MRLKSKLDRLEDKLLADVEEIKLENGEVIRLDEEELLGVLAEAIDYAAGGEGLSDKAKAMRGAESGQQKVIELIKEMVTV